jgi:hypothetical protein
MSSNFGSLETRNDSSREENKLLIRYLQMFIHTSNKQRLPFNLFRISSDTNRIEVAEWCSYHKKSNFIEECNQVGKRAASLLTYLIQSFECRVYTPLIETGIHKR